MKQTDQSLLVYMRITDFDISNLQLLLSTQGGFKHQVQKEQRDAA